MEQRTHARVSPWHSIKTRASLFTLSVFVLGILALSFYASRLLQTDMERLMGEQQFSTVSVMAHEISGIQHTRND